jgi:hypothetical protein
MADVGTFFKYGCLGCLGIVAVLVIAVAVVLGVAWVGVENEAVEDHVLAPAIPAAVEVAEGRAGGRIVLSVREAELSIEVADPGESVRVEARYDTHGFSLEEKLEPASGDGEPWTYEVTFDRRGRSGVSGLRKLLGGGTPKLTVFIPPDTPLELDLDVRKGGAQVELGGLWLTAADINLEMGGLELSVSDPLREPMEHLVIQTAMGGVSMSRIGNASPRRLEVGFRMGGMDLDLRGQWVADAEIDISGSMGGGSVRLPEDVVIEGIGVGGLEAPSDPELKPPTLKFSTSSSMGELEFYD